MWGRRATSWAAVTAAAAAERAPLSSSSAVGTAGAAKSAATGGAALSTERGRPREKLLSALWRPAVLPCCEVARADAKEEEAEGSREVALDLSASA